MRFGEAEMASRFERTRALLGEHDLDALVLFGNSGVNRHNNVNPFWLTEYLDMHHCYLVVPREPDAESVLYVGLVNHVPDARERVETARVEWGGYDPGATVAARLRELGARRAGLVGVNAVWSVGMPWQHHARLREELPELELEELTAAFAGLRIVKSAEEIERIRGAAELTDLAILALQREARPGRSEAELVAICEDAYRRRGGSVRITFLRSMPMAAPNGCLPAQNPGGRRLERGDVILTEFSASLGAYSGQVHRPVFVQAEPTAEWQRLFDVARDGLRADRGRHARRLERGRRDPQRVGDRRGRLRDLRRPDPRLRDRLHGAARRPLLRRALAQRLRAAGRAARSSGT